MIQTKKNASSSENYTCIVQSLFLQRSLTASAITNIIFCLHLIYLESICHRWWVPLPCLLSA